MTLASVRENWSILLAAASVCFGVGGYAAGARIGATVEEQRVVLDQVVRTQERMVDIQEQQSKDVSAILEWIKVHDQFEQAMKQRHAALKAAPEGK